MNFIVFFTILSIFYFFERIFEIKFHVRQQGERKEIRSFQWMLFLHLFYFFSVLLEFFLFRHKIDPAITLIGLIFFFGGLILRKWAIKTLGKYWSVRVEISKNQPLVKDGPYQLCRHPNYLAIILEVVGYCLIANAYFTLIIIGFSYGIVIAYRIKLEEAILCRKYGDKYKSYIRRTDALIPSYKLVKNISSNNKHYFRLKK